MNGKKRQVWPLITALAVLVPVFLFSTYKVVTLKLEERREKAAFDELSGIVASQKSEASRTTGTTTRPTGRADVPDVFVPAPTGPVLPWYRELLDRNPDFFGWIAIEGTPVDYPVMFTPDNPEFYLRRGFDRTYASGGTPFLDGKCVPGGNYYLVYGHHMKNSTMFGSLTRYAERAYFEQHPTVLFDTIYESGEYEIMAVFFSKVEGENSGNFKYYEYRDISRREVFEEYAALCKSASLYDTGVTAEWGDTILTLSTCSYHTDDGRFVVVARKVN